MSATSGSPPHGPSAGRPQARRKTKPKFEIPAEAAKPAAGWVDRGVGPHATVPHSVKPLPAKPITPRPARQGGGFTAAGSELVVFGLVTVGRTFWLGFNILTAPVRYAQRPLTLK